MSAKNTVWVERIDGRVVRVFRGTHSDGWRNAMSAGTLQTCPKKDAIGEVRKQIWERCNGRCEWCGRAVAENGPLWLRMHMHEGIPKGKAITESGSPGEVSIWNSVGICQRCHEDSPQAHGNRKPRWSDTKWMEE